MQLYGILRRNGWATAADLEAPPPARPRRATRTAPAFAGSAATSWPRRSGELGTFCVYEADSPEAIRAHAAASDLPVDEVIPVADTVIVRPDPAQVAS